MSLGIDLGLSISSGPLAAPVAPVLADFSGFQDSTRVWLDIPYGSASWAEPTLGGTTLYQALDIEIPSGSAPVAGWPVVMYYHANGSTKTVPGSGVLATCKAEILAEGFAFVGVEFRHPVVNVSEGAPHQDVGFATQYVRAMADAFDLDTNNVYALCHSRGSLALWQGLQADMANGGASTYEGRQSSYIKGIWAYNPQTTYDTEQFADLFVLPGADTTTFLAANPNDARWGSAITSAATAPNYPLLAIHTETAYFGTPQDAVTADDVHYPDMVSALRDAYVTAGQGAKVADMPSHLDTEKYFGAQHWFRACVSGASGKEAMAIAIAKYYSGLLVYVKTDKSNVYTDSAGTIAANALDVVGNVSNSGVGSAATQATAADKGALAVYGIGYAVGFSDNTDHLVSTKTTANTGTLVFAGQCQTGTYPASAISNITNSTAIAGASLRATAATTLGLRLSNTTTAITATATVTSVQDAHTQEGWWDGTNMKFAADGGTVSTTAQSVNPTTATAYALGRYQLSASGGGWRGYASLWFASDTSLTDPRRKAIARFGALLMGTSYPA